MSGMSDEPKKRSRTLIFCWAFLALLVLYPLSLGPAVWIIMHTPKEWPVRDGLTRACQVIYYPLFRSVEHSNLAAEVLDKYKHCWLFH
jgi:hypothetical protein